uniref:Uncharacterized protein n=1 Tax=Strigamia maritima TaxID=126957 RepID=T1JKD3_STRMM
MEKYYLHPPLVNSFAFCQNPKSILDKSLFLNNCITVFSRNKYDRISTSRDLSFLAEPESKVLAMCVKALGFYPELIIFSSQQ